MNKHGEIDHPFFTQHWRYKQYEMSLLFITANKLLYTDFSGYKDPLYKMYSSGESCTAGSTRQCNIYTGYSECVCDSSTTNNTNCKSMYLENILLQAHLIKMISMLYIFKVHT